jgi:hypothetical protein
MRIQIDDNSAALTPFGSLVSGVVRSKTAGKPWMIAFQADRSHRQPSTKYAGCGLADCCNYRDHFDRDRKKPVGDNESWAKRCHFQLRYVAWLAL